MSAIRDAINQVPSKPAVVLAVVFAIGLAAWYYIPTYNRCAELRQGRQAFAEALAVAAGRADRMLSLDRVIPGDWDEVRIRQGHDPGQAPLDCPFGWDITWRERQALIRAGDYTIIGLFKAGRFQSYIEWRADRGRFAAVPDRIGRARAIFEVDADAAPPRLSLHSSARD